MSEQASLVQEGRERITGAFDSVSDEFQRVQKEFRARTRNIEKQLRSGRRDFERQTRKR